jgi:hypothetical protein
MGFPSDNLSSKSETSSGIPDPIYAPPYKSDTQDGGPKTETREFPNTSRTIDSVNSGTEWPFRTQFSSTPHDRVQLTAFDTPIPIINPDVSNPSIGSLYHSIPTHPPSDDHVTSLPTTTSTMQALNICSYKPHMRPTSYINIEAQAQRQRKTL